MLASLVEELPIGIWPLVGFKKWQSDELKRFALAVMPIKSGLRSYGGLQMSQKELQEYRKQMFIEMEERLKTLFLCVD